MLREAVTKDVFFVEAWAELAYLFEVDGNYLEAERSTPACWTWARRAARSTCGSSA
jgi:hypothetical protein